MTGVRLAWACRKCLDARWLLRTEQLSAIPFRQASVEARSSQHRKRVQPRLQNQGDRRAGGMEGTPRRNWSIPKGVQHILRADVLGESSFDQTVFRNPYPVVHDQVSQELVEKFFKLGEMGKEEMLLKMDFEELERFLSEVAISSQTLSFEDKSLCSDVSVMLLNKLNLVEKLKLTDLVYVCGYLSDSFMSKFLDEVAMEWPNPLLDNSKLLQLLFYICIYRNAPPRLMEQIEAYLGEKIGEITLAQVGLICNAFFASNHAIKDFDLIKAIAAKVMGENFEETPLYLICNIMKALHHADYKKSEFYHTLADRLCDTDTILNDNYMSNLSNIGSAFASGRHTHPRLFEAICENATEIVLRNRGNRTPRLKDLGRIIFSCRTLQLPVSEVLVQELARQVEEDVILREKFPQAFTEAVLALTMMGVYIYPQLGHVLSRRYTERIAERNFEQHYQRLLLDTLVELECPDYQETRLSATYVATLVSSRNTQRGLALHTRQGLAATWLTLEDMFGGPSYVKCHYITNFTRVSDLEFRIGADGQPKRWCEIDESEKEQSLRLSLRKIVDRVQQRQDEHDKGVLAELLREHNRNLNRKKAPNLHLLPDHAAETVRRVAVKVLSENQYVANTPVLLGLHQMELQALTKMGYEVLVINPYDATKIEEASPRERIRLVKALVLKPLNIEIS